jgi:hypothetical protein
MAEGDEIWCTSEKPVLDYAARAPRPKTRWWLVAVFIIGFLMILTGIMMVTDVAPSQPQSPTPLVAR